MSQATSPMPTPCFAIDLGYFDESSPLLIPCSLDSRQRRHNNFYPIADSSLGNAACEACFHRSSHKQFDLWALD